MVTGQLLCLSLKSYQREEFPSVAKLSIPPCCIPCCVSNHSGTRFQVSPTFLRLHSHLRSIGAVHHHTAGPELTTSIFLPTSVKRVSPLFITSNFPNDSGVWVMTYCSASLFARYLMRKMMPMTTKLNAMAVGNPFLYRGESVCFQMMSCSHADCVYCMVLIKATTRARSSLSSEQTSLAHLARTGISIM